MPDIPIRPGCGCYEFPDQGKAAMSACRVMIEKKTSTRFSHDPTTGMSYLWKSCTQSSFVHGEVAYGHRAA